MRAGVRVVLMGRNTLDDYVRAGLAYVVNPTTDTGYKLYGNGRLFLPAGTNYCTNPAFITDTNADGFADGAVETHTTATAPTYTLVAGGQRIQCVGVGADAPAYILPTWNTANSSFAPADPVIVSCLLSGSNGGATVAVRVRSRTNADGSIESAQTGAITLTATPTRYSIAVPSCAATTEKVKADLVITITDGDVLDLTVGSISIEKSSVLTPYGDGSYPGWAWSGVANASTSVRTASALALPYQMADAAGTIVLRAQHLGTAIANRYLVTLGTSNRRLVYLDATNKVGLYIAGGTASQVISSNAVTGAGVYNIIARWTDAKQDIDLNGTSAVQVNRTGTYVPGSTIDFAGALLSVVGGQYAGPALFSQQNAPAAYVTAQQANSGALYSDPVAMVELARRYNLMPFMIAPLQSDSRAFVVTS